MGDGREGTLTCTLSDNWTEVDEYWSLGDINAGIERTAHIVLRVGPKNRTTFTNKDEWAFWLVLKWVYSSEITKSPRLETESTIPA